MTQCVHYFTKQRQGAAAALRTLDVFALLLAAICHDVDHVGLTADFLGGTALDLLYNERSPMESHHLTTTFRILGHPKCNVLAGVAQADRKALRSSIVACVLGTDMSRHAQFLTDFAHEDREGAVGARAPPPRVVRGAVARRRAAQGAPRLHRARRLHGARRLARVPAAYGEVGTVRTRVGIFSSDVHVIAESAR